MGSPAINGKGKLVLEGDRAMNDVMVSSKIVQARVLHANYDVIVYLSQEVEGE